MATTTSLRLALLLATVAGFLDAYSYLDRGGVFANSQSANVVLFGIRASGGAWIAAVRHLPPIVAFAVGTALAQLLQRLPEHGRLRRPARVAISLELAVLIIVGFLPQRFPDVIVASALSFAAGLQGAMFASVWCWSYSSILATGNLRTLTGAVYRAIADRDHGAVLEAASFALLIVAFSSGAALGGLLSEHLHGLAILVAVALLAGAFALYSGSQAPDRRRQDSRDALAAGVADR